jgi:abortive infection bacteriophage resistance protein
MNIENILTAFRQYCTRKKLEHYPSIQIFRDGSGCLLDSKQKYLNGTSFDTVEELYLFLTDDKELREAESKYVDALRNYYPQGTKISMEVRGESVEVIIDTPR